MGCYNQNCFVNSVFQNVVTLTLVMPSVLPNNNEEVHFNTQIDV